MDEEVNQIEEHEKPFSTAEIALMGMGLLIADVLDWFSFGIPIGDIIAFPVLQIYLRLKGLRGIYGWLGNGAELIPFVDYLPLRTSAFLLSAYLANNRPELIMLANKKKGAIPGKTGKNLPSNTSVIGTPRTKELNSPRTHSEILVAQEERERKAIARAGGLDKTTMRNLGAKEITEEDFGMPAYNPMDQTQKELFSPTAPLDLSSKLKESQTDETTKKEPYKSLADRPEPAKLDDISRTWDKDGPKLIPEDTPLSDDGVKKRVDEIEDSLDSGLSRMRKLAENKDILDTMRNTPQARSSKEDGETIDLRKAP